MRPQETEQLVAGVILSKPYIAPYLIYNGTSAKVNCGKEATINNLTGAAFTVEGWFYALDNNAPGWRPFITKQGQATGSGWGLWYGASGTTATALVKGSTGNSQSTMTVGFSAFHHIGFTFDFGGDKKVRAFIDGTIAAAGAALGGVGVDDSARDLTIGSFDDNTYWLHGYTGWVRISNSVRYTGATYTMPERLYAPAVDANTLRLFRFDENVGNILYDRSANEQHGLIINGVWGRLANP